MILCLHIFPITTERHLALKAYLKFLCFGSRVPSRGARFRFRFFLFTAPILADMWMCEEFKHRGEAKLNENKPQNTLQDPRRREEKDNLTVAQPCTWNLWF